MIPGRSAGASRGRRNATPPRAPAKPSTVECHESQVRVTRFNPRAEEVPDPGARILVYRLDLRELPTPGADALAMLSQEERERARAISHPQQFACYLKMHVALGRILAAGLRSTLGKQVQLSDLRFDYGPHGKPRVVGASEAERWRFNLSHSGEIGLIAFALDREVGIDVQVMRPEIPELAIGRRFFSPPEVALLEQFDQLDQGAEARAWFYLLWTRKEAYAKARGMSVTRALSETRMDGILQDARDPDAARRWALCDLPMPAPYAAACAFERPPR